MPNLAISLHAPTEDQRDSSCRSTASTALAEIIEACRRFPLERRERITFEYVMLAGVNDSPDDARRLARLLNGHQVEGQPDSAQRGAGHPVRAAGRRRASIAFAQILADRGIVVSVRKSRGRDIRAACGQLIIESATAAVARHSGSRMLMPV